MSTGDTLALASDDFSTRLSHLSRIVGQRAFLITAASIYAVTLQLGYERIISPTFAYLGYTFTASPTAVQVASFMLATIPATWMPYAATRPSQLVYWYLYLLVFVPAVLIPQFVVAMPLQSVLLLSLALTICLALIGVVQWLPPLSVPVVRINQTTYWLVTAGVAAGLYAYVVEVFGIRLSLPSLAEVYATRAAYKAQLKEEGGAVAYAVLWLAKVINPLFIAVGITKRRWIMLLIGISGQLLLFSITAFKSVFLSAALLVALLLTLSSAGRRFGAHMVGGAAALTVASYAFDSWRHAPIAFGFLIRRLIVTPGLLTGYYYEFFSSHPKAHLGYGALQSLVEYPYTLPPSYIIGARYIKSAETNANANMWADAFANFGFPGVFVATLVLILVLWLYDSLAQRKGLRESFLLLGVPGMALCSSGLQTVLVTHGLVLAMILLYGMPQDPVARASSGDASHSTSAASREPPDMLDGSSFS